MTDIRVATIVGSLRADSMNKKIAEALRDNAPEGVVIDILDGIADLPFYNEELDGDNAPEAAVKLREQVASADRVLVVTPEYNGTMPAVLNNTIDWLSRPYGAGPMLGTPFAVVGAAPTSFGAKWSHEDARRSAGIAGAYVVDGIEVSQSSLEGDVVGDEIIFARFTDALAKLVAAEPKQA